MPDRVKIIHDLEDIEYALMRLKIKITNPNKDDIEWESLQAHLTDIRDLADSVEDELKKGIEYL